MGQNIIELVDLSKIYGSHTAVDRLNLTIRKGEIFGLLGPNGAGKSTTILMMLGLAEPSSGTVRVCGVDSTSNPIKVKRKVGYLPEDVGFYEDRTGIENLVYTAMLNRIPENEAIEKAEQLMKRVGLGDEAGKKAGKYSRGMRQRLGLADVLIKNPEVIILDEPTLGIDPKGVKDFLQLIVQLSKEQGLTVLLSSHHLHQVQQICDRVGIFVNGKMVAEGDIHSLSRQLFADEQFIIEAGIIPAEPYRSDLLGTLKDIEGVLSINRSENIFHIGCSRDASADIAKTIIEAGAGLHYLTRKEYGLDEIYHRYFQGGTP